jgi:hypothetical protein
MVVHVDFGPYVYAALLSSLITYGMVVESCGSISLGIGAEAFRTVGIWLFKSLVVNDMAEVQCKR